MEKANQARYCAFIRGQNIDRQALAAAFGAFGNITKVYVNYEKSMGKVYLDNYSDLRKACIELCNTNSEWNIEYRKDDFKGKPNPDSNTSRKEPNSNRRRHENFDSTLPEPSAFFNGSTSSLSNFQNTQKTAGDWNIQESDSSIMGETESVEFSIAYDFVDSIGRSVEVLENEEKDFFVNLKDVRRNGFQIFRKADYENAIITRIDDLREFEAFLLNQAFKYLIERKRTFSENEVLSCIENVKTRLWGNKDEGRIITPTSTNNFQITSSIPANNHLPGPSSDGSRPPKQLAENFKPSFSHIKAAPKRGRGGKSNYQNHRSDPRDESKGISFRPVQDQGSLRKPKLNGYAKNEEKEKSWGGASEIKPVKAEIIPDIKPTKPESVKADTSAPRDNRISETTSVTSGVSETARLSIERVSLPVRDTPYRVLVSYIQDRPGKSTLYYVQPIDNTAVVEQLLVNVNDLAPSQKDVTPVRDGLYLVQFVGVWYRCMMIHANPASDRCYVELLDYGNKEKLPGPFKEMPESLKKVPAQSVRVKPDQSFDVDWAADDEIDIIVKKQYDDGTHLLEPVPVGLSSSKPVKPVVQEQTKPVEKTIPKAEKKIPKEELKEEQRYFNLPAAFGTIKQGDQVKILGYAGEKFVLMSRECIAHRKEITQYIQEMTHVPLNKVEVNQLVLCSHESRPNLHRAIVAKLNGNVAVVQYLDFAGEEAQLSVKSLRNVDGILAKKPRAVLETAVFPALKTLTPKSEEFLAEIINKGTKLVVGENQNLILEGNQLLADAIKSLDAPSSSPKKATKEPAKPISKKGDPIWYSDMPFFSVKPGVGSFVAFCCQDSQSITLISTSEESVEYMAQLEITPDDEEPYCPQEMEMCLLSFEDSWYRATVLSIDGDVYEMLCVDFGNQCKANSKDIRRISKTLADIPIIGLGAFFTDLPEGNTAINAKLQELIPDQTQLEDVNIISVPDNEESVQYEIKVPSITNKLKHAGLL